VTGAMSSYVKIVYRDNDGTEDEITLLVKRLKNIKKING